MKDLHLKHNSYDKRHTCLLMLTAAKVDQTTIKKSVYNAEAQSLTERVYTHLDMSILLEVINMI